MMLRRCVLAAVAVSALAGPSAVFAQSGDSDRLAAFTRTPVYLDLIKRAVDSLPASVFQRCPELVSAASNVTVISPVRFAASGNPNSGTWRQSFPVKGCGNDTILNVFVAATPDEKMNVVVGLPGTTQADIRLQADALRFAITAALARQRCDRFDVKTTTFESFGVKTPPMPDPGPETRARPWWETWTLIGCGHTLDLPMNFVPSGPGTQIIQPGGIVER